MLESRKVLLGCARAVAAVAAVATKPASAAFPLITVDENGHGALSFFVSIALKGVLASDPGPGGLNSVLTYNLLGPRSLTPGDVLMGDGGSPLDVVRFNDYNTGGVVGYQASLLFYSDNLVGFDALGDTPTPPSAFYPNNVVTIAEVGSENINRAYYHPSVGMPGYVPGSDVAYNLISDAVPEPATWALMLLGFGGLGFAALRKGVAGAMA
jgi:hypothetical protein